MPAPVTLVVQWLPSVNTRITGILQEQCPGEWAVGIVIDMVYIQMSLKI